MYQVAVRGGVNQRSVDVGKRINTADQDANAKAVQTYLQKYHMTVEMSRCMVSHMTLLIQMNPLVQMTTLTLVNSPPILVVVTWNWKYLLIWTTSS